MWPAIAALAGSSFLGAGASIWGAHEQSKNVRDTNEANRQMAAQAMQFSAQQADRQMDFQERMSGTAVQRAAADMKAAGINPMLAAGSGESSPSGASGSASTIPSQIVPSVVSGVSSGAKDLIRLFQEMRESNSRIGVNAQSANKYGQEAGTAFTQSEKNWASKRLIEQSTTAAKMQNRLMEQEMSVFQKSPGLFSLLKLLNERGIGMSSATNLLNVLGD